MMTLIRNLPVQRWATVSLLIFSSLFLTTGCGIFGGRESVDFTDPGVTSPPRATGGSDSPTLHAGEWVMIAFSGTDPTSTLSPHQEQVKGDGMITLPYVGPVRAEGKTLDELQKAIRDLYVPRYYNSNLTVTVTTQERWLYVRGQVRTSGRVAYTGSRMTVTQAIAAAGDFNDFANRKKVKVTRADGSSFIVNCVKVLTDPSQDRQVFPNDQIFVQKKWF